MGMLTILNCYISQWHITPHAHSYDNTPAHIIQTNGQSVLSLKYTLYFEHLKRELQLPIWNLWVDWLWLLTSVCYQKRTSSPYSNMCPDLHKGCLYLVQIISSWCVSLLVNPRSPRRQGHFSPCSVTVNLGWNVNLQSASVDSQF